MSIIAITRTQDNIFLLSDGRQASENTPGVASRTDSRKAYKINDHVGFQWLGYYPFESCRDIMQDMLKDSEATTPSEIAVEAAKYIDGIMTPPRMAKLQGEGRFRICVLIVGYEEGQGVIYKLDSEQSLTTPKKIPLPLGQSAVMGYDKSTSDPRPYEATLNTLLQQGRTPHEATRGALKATVESHKAKGKPVGGQIFCEVLQPKKKSKFRQALLN